VRGRRGRLSWRVGLILLGTGGVVGGVSLRQSPVCGPETPGMAPYGNAPGRVTLRGFSASGPEMTVDIEIADAGEAKE